MPTGVYVRTDAHRAAFNTPEAKANKSASLLETNKNPEVSQRRSLANIKRYEKPTEREKTRLANIKRYEDLAERERQSIRMKEVCSKPEHRKMKSMISIEVQNKPEEKLKRKEIHVGGFTIQNIIYDEGKGYPEDWNKASFERIDEYQGYKSIISGKTKDDNGGRELDRHHLYWDKKPEYCKYDGEGDTKQYYVMINNGTRGKPDIHKHYIKGSIDKIVLLTTQEHGLIKGNKKLGTTKLSWIIYLEGLVNEKLNGRTHYTMEEYNKIKEAR